MASPTADRDAWDERYRSTDSVWGAAPNRFVVEVFTGYRIGRALDLGCGEGRNALWLAGLGWAVTAVDFADTAVERGRRVSEAAGLDVEWIAEDLLPRGGGCGRCARLGRRAGLGSARRGRRGGSGPW